MDGGDRRADSGAVAVEFALVVPLLLIIFFGIFDYGIWFADSISARQAVFDAARRGSVGQFGSCGPSAPNPLQNLACSLKPDMGQISSTVAVRVTVAPAPDAPGGAAWTQGYTLRVCAMTHHDSLFPLVPFPNGGIDVTEVNISIEVDAVTGAATYEEAPLGGASWPSRCT